MRNPSSKRAAGFSLLEVLVAVVLLATGLLALAALQGSLARNSAEAKVRSRIVALMAAEMDNVRSSAYVNVATNATVTADDPDCDAPANDVELAACDVGLGYVEMTRTVTGFGSNASDDAFVEGAVPAGNTDAEFRNVVIDVKWDDVHGVRHTLNSRTVVSELALDSNSPIVDEDTANHVPPKAVVRQANPVTAGMIPIALGNGDSTAASNPTPELVGKNQNQTLVGTRFNVLTYTPSGSLAIIQQRIENEIIKCTCEYGAGGTNLGEIYRTSQWPAIWTGSRYDVHVPDPADKSAPGKVWSSGPKAGVTQSPLCQECCRDHHDDFANTTDPRFDPESTASAYGKFNDTNGTLGAVAPGSGTYVDSCRIIRVDGLWRVASDMYNRNLALLETETISSVQAKTGLPTTSATNKYTTYVKDYLQQYDGTSASAPTNAQSMFDDDARQLNLPEEVVIGAVSNSDSRYLHARGLYVDHLETLAREALTDALASRRANGQCLVGGTDLADCVLPYLPFTTVNLTEIAKWNASSTATLNVNNDGELATEPTQPKGGRTLGIKIGVADTEAKIRHSNSGVAVSTVVKGGIDDSDDQVLLTDEQTFNVGGTSTSNGDDFYVQINGGPANYVLWYIFPSDSQNCQGSVHLRQCSTNTTLPMSGSIRLESYSGEEMVTTAISGWQCQYNNKTVTVSDTSVQVPTFHNYEVSSISHGGTVTQVDNPGLTTEKTTIQFPSITTSNDNLNPIVIGLSDQVAPIPATKASCTAIEINNKGNKTYWIESVTWNKSW